MGNESPARTLAVAGAVAIVCAILVSTAVTVLRPYQLAYAAVDRNRSILRSAQIVDATAPVPDRVVVSEFLELEPRLVDLESGTFTAIADARTYDYETALGNETELLPISASADIAKIGAKPRVMPLYVSPASGRVTLPFFGRGMWSTISGYLTLEPDLDTIAGLDIYSHGETPGIGDRIQNPEWLDRWRGKRVYDASGRVALRVGDSGGNPGLANEYRIDAITGATRTVDGLEASLLFWLGPDGFGPILDTLRNTD